MKEVELKFKDEMPPPVDEEGYEYTYGGAWNDQNALLGAIDLELSAHGLELCIGNIGSSDYFVCVKKRKE